MLEVISSAIVESQDGVRAPDRDMALQRVQPHGAIELTELATGAFAFEAVVADQLAYDRTIFLLDLCELRDCAALSGRRTTFTSAVFGSLASIPR